MVQTGLTDVLILETRLQLPNVGRPLLVGQSNLALLASGTVTIAFLLLGDFSSDDGNLLSNGHIVVLSSGLKWVNMAHNGTKQTKMIKKGPLTRLRGVPGADECDSISSCTRLATTVFLAVSLAATAVLALEASVGRIPELGETDERKDPLWRYNVAH